MDILIYKGGISNAGAKEFLKNNGISFDETPTKTRYDYIVKPPGVPMDEIKIEGKIISDIELIYMLKKPFIVGISGSAGKSTTTLLINEILKEKYQTVLAGNIGIPFGSVYSSKPSIYVLELSSFELESCITLKPRIAVLLNITDAHLDHHGTLDNYIKSKEMITKNQDQLDFLVYNLDDKNVVKIASRSKAIKKSFSLLSEEADIYLKDGYIHTKNNNYDIKNLFSTLNGDIYDIMASILVGELASIDKDKISSIIRNFKKPKYRMEQIAKNIYNDAKSTNILSTLGQISKFKNVNLICGGYDRNNDLEMMKELFPYVDTFYLYGANSERVSSFLKEHNRSYKMFNTLKDATLKAVLDHKTIIYSPMAPSYDQYKSYLERGAEFENLIEDIKKESFQNGKNTLN